MPSNERLGEIIEAFERKFGFPNCGGAIDGTHIPIIAPQHHHTDYYNRKGYYSIVAQVVCDHEYKVLSVVAGWPGRVHDARVFTNFSLCEKGHAGTLLPHRPRRIGETDVPVMLIGNSAYPLLPWLMKPYRDTGRLTREALQLSAVSGSDGYREHVWALPGEVEDSSSENRRCDRRRYNGHPRMIHFEQHL